MEYRQLSNSDLRVPIIGLGSDTFGRDIDEKTTAGIIDHALSLGINYIDTADVYGWGGWAERYTGLAVKGKRSRFIIATKFGVRVSEDLPQGTFSLRHDLNSLFDVYPHNVLMIKINKWFTL